MDDGMNLGHHGIGNGHLVGDGGKASRGIRVARNLCLVNGRIASGMGNGIDHGSIGIVEANFHFLNVEVEGITLGFVGRGAIDIARFRGSMGGMAHSLGEGDEKPRRIDIEDAETAHQTKDEKDERVHRIIKNAKENHLIQKLEVWHRI